MDGLTQLRAMIALMILLLIPLTGIAENQGYQIKPCQCEYHEAEEGFIIGNGREFKKTNRYEYFVGEEYADIYPLYEDRHGIEAYFEGMLILELRQVENYDVVLAWRVKADSFTTYDDLGITFLEFEDIEKAEEAYKLLRDSKDPNIEHLEMALVENSVW